jgi:hypothetical protein
VCSSFATQGYVVPYSNPGLTVAKTTLSSAEVIQGDGIPIFWQSSDLSILEAATTATVSFTSQAPTGILRSSPASTMPSNTSVASPSTSASAAAVSGLSTGAKIGLGVGISLGAIVILLLGVCIWLLHRNISRSNKMQGSLESNHEARTTKVAEGQGQRGPAELVATDRQGEISAQPAAVQELGGSSL